MSWRVLIDLINSMFGRALLVVGFSAPMAILFRLGVEAENYKFMLMGALIIILTFYLVTIFAPKIISTFNSGDDFSIFMGKLNADSLLDVVSEFKFLELESNKRIMNRLSSRHYEFYKFSTVDKAIEELGKNAAVRSLSVLKYEVMNTSNICFVWVLFFTYLIGTILIFLPLINNIKTIFGA